MSKRHTDTLYYVITVYNDMFDHMDGMMQALTKKETAWKEDLFFAVKLAGQKLSKYYADVTPTTGMLLISTQILDPFRKLRSFRKWDKGMDINPEDETSYTTQYQEAFLMYVENETAPNIDVCRSINSKRFLAAISSPLQWLQGLINHPLIHMICPAMMRDT